MKTDKQLALENLRKVIKEELSGLWHLRTAIKKEKLFLNTDRLFLSEAAELHKILCRYSSNGYRVWTKMITPKNDKWMTIEISLFEATEETLRRLRAR